MSRLLALRSLVLPACVGIALTLTGCGAAGGSVGAHASPPAAPATAAEAASVINLETFPLAPGAVDEGNRSVARQIYRTTAGPRETYAFLAKELKDAGWTEDEGGYDSETSFDGAFEKDGFNLTVSASLLGDAGDKDAMTMVMLVNFGNVLLDKLPVPAGSTLDYSFPATTMYTAPGTVDETVAEVERLLAAEGWAPYGSAGDTHDYKRNAILLKATVQAAPAKDGKTVISFSTEQLSADLPAPADAYDIRYSEPSVQMMVDFKGTVDEADAWYRGALGKLGWKSTTERPVDEGFTSFVIYRNEPGEMVEINLSEIEAEGDRPAFARLNVEFTSAAEMEAMERRWDEQKKELEAKKAAKAGADSVDEP